MSEDEIEENEKIEPIEEEIDEIADLNEKLKEFENKYLRALADSENARKRMLKEKQELTKYGIENALSDLLHPIDAFEKALSFAETMSDEVKNWAIGFEMILSQFKQVLSDNGIEEYHSIGKKFDPHWHEAIEMIETDEYEPGIIVEEDVRGYKAGDRPVRVARVKVAKELPNNENNQEDK